MACSDIDNIIDKFNVFTEKPAKFLTVQTDVKDDLKDLVKSLYDYTKTQEKVDKKVQRSALTELIVQDFDEEQVWQQIELHNAECWDQLVWEVANCISTKTDLTFPVTTAKDATNGVEESGEETPTSEDEQSDNEPETKNQVKKPKRNVALPSKSKGKPSIVDDQFFKLQELEKFLIQEEKKDGKAGSDSEESINMFEEIDDEDSADEEGGKEAMYNDFFSQDGEEDIEQSEKLNDDDDYLEHVEDEDDDQQENGEADENDKSEESEQEIPKKNDKKVRFAEADQSSDDDSDESDDGAVPSSNKATDEKKSEFEMRQERLKKQIEKLEERTLSEAPWQLKGEVDAMKRPQNSLLEEVVDFDLTSRPAPIITEQTTITLEDIIIRRIKDKAWDDVEKKEKPVDDQLAFRKTEILDYSKSKQSLAQVYEAEYLKQKQTLSGEVEEEKEPEAHTEVREAMGKLFAKLDALCHYHYTPRAPQAEVKIVSNIPAISMEEVAPVATSDAVLLAPEEIKRKRKGELMSKGERTQTDKNRERRRKKKLQKAKGNITKVTEHRNTQKGLQTDDKSLKTSKAFFQQLNDDSTSVIKKNRNVKNKGQ
ncbi:unnamed protein product [Arctia plantaginis]|uniref:U3 small nucleolar ribonucleoprotein protein MPP10 n=1 Tax=Arctia plantaginis TaxID=874455 RepID=A0A8S1A503_ARCPL|nr:unnamed protein product [Arctia plantaginis]